MTLRELTEAVGQIPSHSNRCGIARYSFNSTYSRGCEHCAWEWWNKEETPLKLEDYMDCIVGDITTKINTSTLYLETKKVKNENESEGVYFVVPFAWVMLVLKQYNIK